jgi:hypothetical protein
MNFQKSMRNIAFASAFLLALLTLREQHMAFQIVFGTVSIFLTVIGAIYCLSAPQIKMPEMDKGITIRKVETFLVDPNGITKKSIIARHYIDGELKKVRIP